MPHFLMSHQSCFHLLVPLLLSAKEDESEDEKYDKEEKPSYQFTRTRSRRKLWPVHKYVATHHNHLLTKAIKKQKYTIKTAKIVEQDINELSICADF